MGYQSCLEKAGAKVFDFKEFGSYQGDWLAFVEYNGEKGIVKGSYGSCSGCDAFQAEFDYFNKPEELNGVYYKTGSTWDEDDICTKEEFEQAKNELEERYKNFGLNYLTSGLEPLEYFERKLSTLREDEWFDDENREWCNWAIEMFKIHNN